MSSFVQQNGFLQVPLDAFDRYYPPNLNIYTMILLPLEQYNFLKFLLRSLQMVVAVSRKAEETTILFFKKN